MVGHRPRCPVPARFPVHVTLRLREGLRGMRKRPVLEVLWDAFGRSQKDDFRVVHFAVMGNHLHLIVEGEGRASIRRGMQGLAIRVARALNKHWGRRGKVFADRYQDEVLDSPTRVRNALRYVLMNAKHHGIELGQVIDVATSAPWFDGWEEELTIRNRPEAPVVPARTWLLRVGWQRAGPGGRMRFDEMPSTGPPRRRSRRP